MNINQLKELRPEEFVKIREMLSDQTTWQIIDFDYTVNSAKENNVLYAILYKNLQTNEYSLLKYSTARGYSSMYFYKVDVKDEKTYNFNLPKPKTF